MPDEWRVVTTWGVTALKTFMADSHKTLRTRFLQALEMTDIGFAMMRENLRRRFPDASESELNATFGEWITTRPPLGGVDLKVTTGPAAERRFLKV